jgi:hypothetical protein
VRKAGIEETAKCMITKNGCRLQQTATYDAHWLFSRANNVADREEQQPGYSVLGIRYLPLTFYALT